MSSRRPRFVLVWMILAASAARSAGAEGADRVEFNRDVRPILSENCFACHGPDKGHRKGELRLDIKEGLAKQQDGVRVVVAGDPAFSELYRRLITHDPEERMPSRASGRSLTEAQIATLKAWIEQGAEYQGHWSYLPPRRPEVPALDETGFARNPVDLLSLAKLKDAGLLPSPEADRATLLRRLSFDLTGLPPTRPEVLAFLADQSPDAYEKQVDRLLASPRYGERMAEWWLDLVRFADTIGYHSDNPRNISPYRDYVIRAFADNKPFDRFTVEQLAGDLLPGATLEQKVASGYNRLLQTTEEGGAQAKEYEAKYAADRVRNASTVWLGATMGCCQCHDHKFDPFSTREFYGFAAFFADIQEAAVGAREPGMLVPTEVQSAQLATLEQSITQAKARLAVAESEQSAGLAAWEKNRPADVVWTPLEPSTATVSGGSTLRIDPGGVVKSDGKGTAEETDTVTALAPVGRITAIRLEALEDADAPSKGPGTAHNGNFVLTEFKVATLGEEPDAKPQSIKLKRAVADHAQDTFPIASAIDGRDSTGWAILPLVGRSHEAVFELETPLDVVEGTSLRFALEFRSQYTQHQIARFRISTTGEADSLARWTSPTVREALALPVEKRDEAQAKAVLAHFRAVAPSPQIKAAEADLADFERRKADLLAAIPKTLISNAGPPRTTRVLPRGNWLDESGEVVEPHVPKSLGQVEKPGRRPTRLDLARWIASRDNPLTARVAVNRLWKLAFGQGLARSLEDLGAQGEWPTHPELLDWLAVEFMDHGWDVKHVVRLMVTSGTYRQTSLTTPSLKEVDPFNRFYARQSRYRLDAEAVRDNALAVAGLLSPEVGGPSVKPYQPAGYWDALNFPTRTWQASKGPEQYRRGLYTHWQRSFLHPSLQAFDATSREECTAERARSNIPQQALVLLNDPSYVEAARAFAVRVIREGGGLPGERVAWAFETATSRKPADKETAVLLGLLARHADHYRRDSEAAKKLLAVGQWPAPADLDPSELASWTSVARVLLNLHETITRD
jgi:mono/diheme cytochrome c family protein